MLVIEVKEKRKLVKNNLLPVLPFLLCGEEKEREEEGLDGDDVWNATVFQFLWYYLLSNDSLRFLLLSDERKVFLNKTLLFSLRRDSPFTRRECLHVFNYLFYYGSEEEVGLVIESGGIKCVIVKMREKEEREEGVKENGKSALTYCLSYYLDEKRIPYRMKEGWKGEGIMREMMWMIEEDNVKETLVMSCSHGIFKYNVISFKYGLGLCLHVREEGF
jgi:hypothetical protein